LALNSQLLTVQILANDVQVLILCLSYFITTVLNLPKFQVPIEAVPPPVTSWYQNDKELLTRDGLKVVHNPCMAKLMFIPALRPLSGKYLLKAKNQV
jgi:hypothetical protein